MRGWVAAVTAGHIWGCAAPEVPDGGCESGAVCETDTGEAANDTGGDIDSDPCGGEAHADRVPLIVWADGGLWLNFCGFGTGPITFGFAHVKVGGWEGEDCLAGPGPSGSSGDWDFCHDNLPASVSFLRGVTTPEEVVNNESTLFSEEMGASGHVEMVLAVGADCYTWGGGQYYAGYGCQAM